MFTLATETQANRSKNNPALIEFSNLVSLWKNNPTCAGGPRAVTKKRQSGKGKLTIAQELTFLGILTTIFKNSNSLQGQSPLQTAQLAEYQQNMNPILGVDPLVRSPIWGKMTVFTLTSSQDFVGQYNDHPEVDPRVLTEATM